MIRQAVTALSITALACSFTSGQTYQGQGTAVGGLAGAVIGGIIGHQNDEVPEGALIGGAVGAIAGNVLGAHRDQDVAMHRYYQQQMYQRQYVAQRAVSTGDVVAMCRSGLSDAVVIGHIQANGVQRRLEVSDVISLHQQGVSESVIHAMQSASIGAGPTYVATPPVQPRVIVHEYYHRPYPTPVYHSFNIHYGHGHHHHGCRW
jgi:hypothetical protein